MKRSLLIAILILPLGLAAAEVQGVFEGLSSGASNDLKKAEAELSALRSQIEAERKPLAQKLRELEQKLAERKTEYTKAQRFQENQLVELNALKSDARKRAEEVKYVDSLLSEYRRAFQSRLHFAEEPRYRNLLEKVDKAATSADLSPAQKFAERAALLTTALQREEVAMGGEVFDGKALDKAGKLQQGKVAMIGPVAMFASSSGGPAGLLQQELNKSDPTILQVDPKLDAGSAALVTSGQGQLVLDPTLGSAFKLTALRKSLYERFAEGGLIMIPLLGLGALVVLVALFKWFQLSRIRVATEADLQRVLADLGRGAKDAALAHAKRIRGVAGDLLTTAVEHYDEKKEYIEEIVYEKMLGARTKLERGIPFLALAATTGPLLGLLGTVMGMIATFRMISSVGSGDPKQLAAGISEALICTATGMGVAIPALLFHAFLSRKAKGIIGRMEQTSVGFINGVPEVERTAFEFNNRMETTPSL